MDKDGNVICSYQELRNGSVSESGRAGGTRGEECGDKVVKRRHISREREKECKTEMCET